MVPRRVSRRLALLAAAAAVGALAAALPAPVAAEPILPAGAYPALDAQMARHGRQFWTLNARPFGLSLDVHVRDAAARALVDAFLAQDASDDFAAVTGAHPYELMADYGEHGDLGFFGGVALAAPAFEYRTLKREGAPADVLARARARVVRAIESWHVFYVVTGGHGVVARGIRRLVPEDPAEPPLPGGVPAVVPLADETGRPLPQPKDNGSWRADLSGGLLPEGEWMWVDSCSKDQLVGQVFGMVALYDAVKDDPDVDQALLARMREDARQVGEMLMEKRQIAGLEGAGGTGVYDLIIMDADGRPTMYHDLNPLSLEKLYLPHGSPGYNLFNLVMAWGVIKGLHHISGDERLEEFLYEELLARRDFVGKLERWDQPAAVDYLYAGLMTNFDVPDMTSIALWLALYPETDPELEAVLRAFLEDGWWAREGSLQTARLCKQPLWHAVYLALTDRGPAPELAAELADLLGGFSLGPYWNDRRVNCDAAEIEARECLAVDGATVLTVAGQDPSGTWMARESLHPSIRPPSNFDARSNPFAVNGGGGGDLLNPGGDLLASYWIARYMQAGGGSDNRSPHARAHRPVGGWPVGPGDGGDAGPPDVAAPDVAAPDVAAPDVGEGDAAPDAAGRDAGGGAPDAGGPGPDGGPLADVSAGGPDGAADASAAGADTDGTSTRGGGGCSAGAGGASGPGGPAGLALLLGAALAGALAPGRGRQRRAMRAGAAGGLGAAC
jgi:hypothetical protein